MGTGANIASLTDAKSQFTFEQGHDNENSLYFVEFHSGDQMICCNAIQVGMMKKKQCTNKPRCNVAWHMYRLDVNKDYNWWGQWPEDTPTPAPTASPTAPP